MVGVLELVLDDHLASGAGFLRINVHIKRAHRRFGFYKLKFNANRRTQHGKVWFLRKPLGKVKRLMRPHIAQLDFPKFVEVEFRHS